MTPARNTLLWCLACVSALTTTYIGALTLIAVDETRYAGVALEMWQRGDWLVPYSNGLPYSDKPPLLFWLMDAGWTLFGVSVWWPRVAVALASLAGAGLTAGLARLLWPDRRDVAALAPVILLGSTLWALWTPAVMFDVVLAVWTLIGITGFVMQAGRYPRPGAVLVALGIGGGVLTKGPVIILHVLPVGLLAPLWHPGRVSWRRWYARLALGVLGGAAIALAWAVPAALRGGPDYARAIFWGQSAGRMVASFAHAQPWWWYAALLPLALLPWSGWLSAWRCGARLRLRGDWGLALLASWLAPALITFSLVSGKQIHYLLPLFPGLALLLARALAPHDDAPSPWWDAAPLAVALLLLAAVTAWAPGAQAARQWPAWVADVPVWTPVALTLLALATLAPLRHQRARAFLLASASAATVVVVIFGVVRPAMPWYDLTPVARVAAAAQRAGMPVAHVGNYHNRLRFLGRLEQPVAVIDDGDLPAWAHSHPNGLVVRYYDHRAEMPAGVPAVIERPFRSDWVRVVRASALLASEDDGHAVVSQR